MRLKAFILFLIIFTIIVTMATYTDLGYDDNLMVRKPQSSSISFENIESQISPGSINPYSIGNVRQTQLSSDEWIPLNPPAVPSHTSASRISFISLDPTNLLRVGDKVRLKQGGSFKYFFVLWVRSTYIEVIGGSNYSVANSAITDFSYSRADRPVGFPIFMPYTSVWVRGTGTGTLTTGTVATGFHMSGKFIKVIGYADNCTYNVAEVPTIRAFLPTPMFVVGDVNNDGVENSTDFSIVLSGLNPDDSIYLNYVSTADIPNYYFESTSTYRRPATFSIEREAQYLSIYKTDPSYIEIRPQAAFSTSANYKFSFETTYIFDYYGN